MITALQARLLTAYAITLKNPWAHLIAHHGKDVENRSWMPHAGVDTLLIHAGKAWDPHNNRRPLVGDIGEPVTSAIVAIADLAFACETSRWVQGVECACGAWAQPGQCHWKLANVRPLATPVPADGRQGLWRPSADLLVAVEAEVAGRA